MTPGSRLLPFHLFSTNRHDRSAPPSPLADCSPSLFPSHLLTPAVTAPPLLPSEQGNITVGDVAMMLPFNDYLYILAMTGQVCSWGGLEEGGGGEVHSGELAAGGANIIGHWRASPE